MQTQEGQLNNLAEKKMLGIQIEKKYEKSLLLKVKDDLPGDMEVGEYIHKRESSTNCPPSRI